MTTVTFEDVKRHNTALIRKALEGSVFVKEWHPDGLVCRLHLPAEALGEQPPISQDAATR